MSKKEFREGDKVFVCDDNSINIDIFDTWEDGKCRLQYSKKLIAKNRIYHDHDRKISAAVQKAIEENETKPARKVKRWVNLYLNTNKNELFLGNTVGWETKDEAVVASKRDLNENYEHIKITEIEIEEDKL